MKNILKIISLSLIHFISLANIGQILHQKGEVKILRGDREIHSKRNAELFTSDIIVTKENAIAIIKLQDLTIIKINKNSSLKITNLLSEKKPTIIELNEGSSFFKVNKAKKTSTDKLVIKTRTAALGVRGTTFFTAVLNTKSASDTWMCVQEGEVIAKNNNTKEVKTVKTGEGLKISSEAKLQDPRFLPWTKGLNWNLDFNNTNNDIENKLNIREAYEDILSTDYE